MKSESLGSLQSGNTDQFQEFRDFLQDACGIDLADNKKYLVNTRLKPILKNNNIESLADLVVAMRSPRSMKLKEQVVDAMTTNETFWFRDTYPFEYMKSTLLPEMQEKDKGFNRMRIWCAACSSGQEPYSLSMTIEEYRRLNMGNLRRQVDILGTDLSPSMLDTARRAEYDRMSVTRGLSKDRLEMFFDKLGDERWRLKPVVREKVQFKDLNLMDSYVSMGKFDFVFCRNVLIYFSHDLKTDILRRIHSVLVPGGYMFLGSSEGLAGVSDLFEMINCRPGIVYKAK